MFSSTLMNILMLSLFILALSAFTQTAPTHHLTMGVQGNTPTLMVTSSEIGITPEIDGSHQKSIVIKSHKDVKTNEQKKFTKTKFNKQHSLYNKKEKLQHFTKPTETHQLTNMASREIPKSTSAEDSEEKYNSKLPKTASGEKKGTKRINEKQEDFTPDSTITTKHNEDALKQRRAQFRKQQHISEDDEESPEILPATLVKKTENSKDLTSDSTITTKYNDDALKQRRTQFKKQQHISEDNEESREVLPSTRVRDDEAFPFHTLTLNEDEYMGDAKKLSQLKEKEHKTKTIPKTSKVLKEDEDLKTNSQESQETKDFLDSTKNKYMKQAKEENPRQLRKIKASKEDTNKKTSFRGTIPNIKKTEDSETVSSLTSTPSVKEDRYLKQLKLGKDDETFPSEKKLNKPEAFPTFGENQNPRQRKEHQAKITDNSEQDFDKEESHKTTLRYKEETKAFPINTSSSTSKEDEYVEEGMEESEDFTATTQKKEPVKHLETTLKEPPETRTVKITPTSGGEVYLKEAKEWDQIDLTTNKKIKNHNKDFKEGTVIPTVHYTHQEEENKEKPIDETVFSSTRVVKEGVKEPDEPDIFPKVRENIKESEVFPVRDDIKEFEDSEVFPTVTFTPPSKKDQNLKRNKMLMKTKITQLLKEADNQKTTLDVTKTILKKVVDTPTFEEKVKTFSFVQPSTEGDDIKANKKLVEQQLSDFQPQNSRATAKALDKDFNDKTILTVATPSQAEIEEILTPSNLPYVRKVKEFSLELTDTTQTKEIENTSTVNTKAHLAHAAEEYKGISKVSSTRDIEATSTSSPTTQEVKELLQTNENQDITAFATTQPSILFDGTIQPSKEIKDSQQTKKIPTISFQSSIHLLKEVTEFIQPKADKDISVNISKAKKKGKNCVTTKELSTARGGLKEIDANRNYNEDGDGDDDINITTSSATVIPKTTIVEAASTAATSTTADSSSETTTVKDIRDEKVTMTTTVNDNVEYIENQKTTLRNENLLSAKPTIATAATTASITSSSPILDTSTSNNYNAIATAADIVITTTGPLLSMPLTTSVNIAEEEVDDDDDGGKDNNEALAATEIPQLARKHKNNHETIRDENENDEDDDNDAAAAAFDDIEADTETDDAHTNHGDNNNGVKSKPEMEYIAKTTSAPTIARTTLETHRRDDTITTENSWPYMMTTMETIEKTNKNVLENQQNTMEMETELKTTKTTAAMETTTPAAITASTIITTNMVTELPIEAIDMTPKFRDSVSSSSLSPTSSTTEKVLKLLDLEKHVLATYDEQEQPSRETGGVEHHDNGHDGLKNIKKKQLIDKHYIEALLLSSKSDDNHKHDNPIHDHQHELASSAVIDTATAATPDTPPLVSSKSKPMLLPIKHGFLGPILMEEKTFHVIHHAGNNPNTSSTQQQQHVSALETQLRSGHFVELKALTANEGSENNKTIIARKKCKFATATTFETVEKTSKGNEEKSNQKFEFPLNAAQSSSASEILKETKGKSIIEYDSPKYSSHRYYSSEQKLNNEFEIPTNVASGSSSSETSKPQEPNEFDSLSYPSSEETSVPEVKISKHKEQQPKPEFHSPIYSAQISPSPKYVKLSELTNHATIVHTTPETLADRKTDPKNQDFPSRETIHMSTKDVQQPPSVLSTTVFQTVESVATKTPIIQGNTMFTSRANEDSQTRNKNEGEQVVTLGNGKTESKISDIQIEVYDSTIDSIVASTNFKDNDNKSSKEEELTRENIKPLQEVEESAQGKTTKPPSSSLPQERFTQYVIDRTETSTQESINYSTIQVASGKPEPAAIEIHINVSESFGNESEDLEFSYPQAEYNNNNERDSLRGGIEGGEESYDDSKTNDNIKLKIPSNGASTTPGKDGRSDEVLVVEVIDTDNSTGRTKNSDDLFISDNTPPPPPPPPPYQTNFDRDSDTIFYISNTEVKVGESIPSDAKNSYEERKLKLENQFFPANYMASTHPNLNSNIEDINLPRHLYEEDIILSSNRNQADSLKIYRNRNDPSPPLDVTYVGESIIEVEQSPDFTVTTTYNPLDQSHIVGSPQQLQQQADVIIQPALLPEISIGVPVIGELPPQIELKEIDFMPNEAQLHRSGIYEENENSNNIFNNDIDDNIINNVGSSGYNNQHDVDGSNNGIQSNNKQQQRLNDESSIQYGGDLIDESADGGFDGVEGSYPFGNPVSAAASSLTKSRNKQQNHVADYAHLYVNYGVNNMRKDELSADVKDSGEIMTVDGGAAVGVGGVVSSTGVNSSEQNITFYKEFLNKVSMNNNNNNSSFMSANLTQTERMSNATAFSVMEDTNDLEDKNTEDIVNLISLAIGLFIVILPVVVTCSMFWALRYLYKKYHSNVTDSSGYSDQTDTKAPMNEDGAEKGEFKYEPPSPSSSLKKCDKDAIHKIPDTSKNPSTTDSIVKFSSEKSSHSDQTNSSNTNTSSVLKAKDSLQLSLALQPFPLSAESHTVHDEIDRQGPNGSITKMTLENNLLIVETEERNDISRVARETKMDYNKDGVFVVEVARGIDSKSIPESPVTEGSEKMLSMFDSKHNNGVLGYKVTNEKNCINNEKVQIHSPPPEQNADEGPRSLHQIEEVEEPINSPHYNDDTLGNEGDIKNLAYTSNTGLSQSDLSITSSNDSNKDYCYGNQALYVVEHSGYSTMSPTGNVVLKCDSKDIKDEDRNPENDHYLKHSPDRREDKKQHEDVEETVKKQQDSGNGEEKSPQQGGKNVVMKLKEEISMQHKITIQENGMEIQSNEDGENKQELLAASSADKPAIANGDVIRDEEISQINADDAVVSISTTVEANDHSLPVESLNIKNTSASNGLPLPEETLDLTEACLSATESELPLPEETLHFAEQSLLTTETELALPEETLQLDEQSLATTESELPLPEEILNFAEQSLLATETELALPEETLQLDEQSLATIESELPISDETLTLEDSKQPLTAVESEISIPDVTLTLIEPILPLSSNLADMESVEASDSEILLPKPSLPVESTFPPELAFKLEEPADNTDTIIAVPDKFSDHVSCENGINSENLTNGENDLSEQVLNENHFNESITDNDIIEENLAENDRILDDHVNSLQQPAENGLYDTEKEVLQLNGNHQEEENLTTENHNGIGIKPLTNGIHTLPDLVTELEETPQQNGNSLCETPNNSTIEMENGYDSILSLPEPPPTSTDEQLNNDLSDQQLDSLPPPPPPETFNLKDLPPPLTNGDRESLPSEECNNFYNTLPPPPPTTLEVTVTTNGNKMHASPLTPPASPPAHFTNNLHAGLCPQPIAVDVNGS